MDAHLGATDQCQPADIAGHFDELEAAVFSCLHGHYRQAMSGLRSALECQAICAYVQVCNAKSLYDDWAVGNCELVFGKTCDGLSAPSVVSSVLKSLRHTFGDSVLDCRDKNLNYAGGWLRQLYRTLSKPSQVTPGFSNGDIWANNGPI